MSRVFSGLLRYSRYLQYQQARFGTSSTMEKLEKSVESSIRKKLTEAFTARAEKAQINMNIHAVLPVPSLLANKPSVLEVKNESNMHKVPKGSETHFKVLVVTDKFNSVPLIKRHRLVNETLQEELQSGVHALSIVAKTPAQWEESEEKHAKSPIGKSPPCKGGFGL